MLSYKEEDFFHFKSFKLANKYASFKINTDGVLLAAWSSRIKVASSILDVGTGTGVIAMIKALQHPAARVDAIEIDQSAYMEAVYNFQLNKVDDQVRCFNIAFNDYHPDKQYDYIISNPPFYTTNQLPKDHRLAAAKHSILLSAEMLWKNISRLAKSGCRLALVYPISAHAEHLRLSSIYGFQVCRICRVQGKEGGRILRCLVEFSKAQSDFNTIEESNLAIRSIDGKGFTPDYIALCEPYYLKPNN